MVNKYKYKTLYRLIPIKATVLTFFSQVVSDVSLCVLVFYYH